MRHPAPGPRPGSLAAAVAGVAALVIGGCGGSGSGGQDAAASQPDAGYPPARACAGELAGTGVVALPRNLIFIMGDGMGPAQVRAAGLHQGGPLGFEALGPPVYLNSDSLTTDAAADPDAEPTDSAASATAMATGVRVGNGVVSVSPEGGDLPTVFEQAKAAGKATGLVTTSFFYDASPAAFGAHAASRDAHPELITELLAASQPDVILGGGGAVFAAGEAALRDQAAGQGYDVVATAAELTGWSPTANPRLLGMFSSSWRSNVPSIYEWYTTPTLHRTADSTDPTLDVMTARALDVVAGDPDGFFLFIENEHIDSIGHMAILDRDDAMAALPLEVVEVDKAFQVAMAWIEANAAQADTLIVVGADHETGGYTLYGDDLADAVFWGATHSRQPVGFYAAGPGADRLATMCRVRDLHLLVTGQLP